MSKDQGARMQCVAKGDGGHTEFTDPDAFLDRE